LANQTLSPRAALAVGVVAAVLGWLAVMGIVYIGRHAANFVEAKRSSPGFNEIASGGARPADR
jgi:hypothetical protein